MRIILLHLFIDVIFSLLKKNKAWFVSRVDRCVASKIFILPSSTIASPLTRISMTTLISNGQILFGPRARVFKLIIRGVKLAWWSTITDLFNLQKRNNALGEQGRSLSHGQLTHQSGKFLLVESGLQGFGIRNIAKEIRNPTKDYPLHGQRLESST